MITVLEDHKHLTAHDRKATTLMLQAGQVNAYSPRKRFEVLEGDGHGNYKIEILARNTGKAYRVKIHDTGDKTV